MPKLVRLYIVNVAIGFGLSVVFLGGILWMDVGGLRHLILDTPLGYVAGAMMIVANGIIFAGAQFAIAVMRLAEPEDRGPRGGTRAPTLIPVRVEATARAPARRR